MSTTSASRPLGITVLAVLAAIAGILALVHMLQALALLPFIVGPFIVIDFSLWGAIMWALSAWVWLWLTQMLWRVEPQAWIFLVIVTIFNLVLDFTFLVGRAEWSDVSFSFIVNALILIYCMLPGVRRAFVVLNDYEG
jgi:hypothetical protein